jgi:phage terminase small subunit
MKGLEEIVRLKKQLADSVMLDARQVLQKYIDIAFADITDFVEFDTKTNTTKEYVGTNAVVSKSVRKYADKNEHYEISTLLVCVCRKQAKWATSKEVVL